MDSPELTFQTDNDTDVTIPLLTSRIAPLDEAMARWKEFDAVRLDFPNGKHVTWTLGGLTFDRLRKQNVFRCNQDFHGLDSWSPNDWATALAGEVGELCNELKKLRRGDDKTGLDEALRMAKVANEAADVVCYLDLLCARMRIDLAAAVKHKFNEVSIRRGSQVRL